MEKVDDESDSSYRIVHPLSNIISVVETSSIYNKKTNFTPFQTWLYSTRKVSNKFTIAHIPSLREETHMFDGGPTRRPFRYLLYGGEARRRTRKKHIAV